MCLWDYVTCQVFIALGSYTLSGDFSVTVWVSGCSFEKFLLEFGHKILDGSAVAQW